MVLIPEEIAHYVHWQVLVQFRLPRRSDYQNRTNAAMNERCPIGGKILNRHNYAEEQQEQEHEKNAKSMMQVTYDCVFFSAKKIKDDAQ